LSGKPRVTAGNRNPLTFWDFAESVETLERIGRSSGAPVEDEVPEGRQPAAPPRTWLAHRSRIKSTPPAVGQPQHLSANFSPCS